MFLWNAPLALKWVDCGLPPLALKWVDCELLLLTLLLKFEIATSGRQGALALLSEHLLS